MRSYSSSYAVLCPVVLRPPLRPSSHSDTYCSPELIISFLRMKSSDLWPFLVFVIVVLFWVIFSLKADAATLVAPTLPDPKLTPGALAPGVVSSLTKEQLCAKGFSTKSVRDVSEETKAFVYKAYGAKDHVGICNCPVTDKKTGKIRNEGCEVDHV
jgi:hypothetical protein